MSSPLTKLEQYLGSSGMAASLLFHFLNDWPGAGLLGKSTIALVEMEENPA